MATIDYSIKDLEKVLEADGIVKSVEVSRFVPPGENYSSLVLKADFKVEKNGQISTISTVAKRVPMGNNAMLPRAIGSQQNEIIFYRKIVPLILNFAREHGLYNEANIYPEFCGSRFSLDPSKTQADEESIVLLKNLKTEGYDVVDRYIGFDLDTSKVIVKKIAAFHAIPIAIKLTRPETFKILADYFESCEQKHSGPPPGLKKGEGPKHNNRLLEAVRDMPESAPYISKLEPLFSRPMMGPSRTSVTEPWVTITHNDFWGNNILIKPNEGKEPSVILLDHARSSYDSFAKDLLFFLLTSVQNEFQEKYMDDLLRIYYDEFTRLLRQCGVSSVLTFDEYMDEVNIIARQNEIGHAVGFSNIIFGSKQATLDHLVGRGSLWDQLEEASKDINQYHKNKILSIASLSAKRNWI